MNSNPRKSTNNIIKFPTWLTVIIAITVLFVLIILESTIKKDYISTQPTKKQIAEMEQERAMEQINKNMEKVILSSLGDSYGSVDIHPFFKDILYQPTLLFKNDLTDEEARNAGTLVVKAMLAELAKSGDIERVTSRNMKVSAEVYSWQPIPVEGIEKSESNEVMVYMGQAKYNASTNRIYWVYGRK